MSQISCKKLISILLCILIALSIFLPYIDADVVVAATVAKTTETTKKKKTVGAKIEGAEYYDELWEKYRVIAVDNGGGSGGGGGAGDKNQSHAGNSGTSNEAGGVFGEAAGQGLGSGNVQNISGSGAGTTGSKTADALRAQKMAIEESRNESIAKEIESAVNASIALERIRLEESIRQSSIKKAKQESIKQSIVAKETNTFETLPSIEAAELTDKPVYEPDKNVKQVNESSIKPTKPINETNAEIAPSEVTVSSVEPGDFIEETEPKNRITTTLIESIAKPTGEVSYVESNIKADSHETDEGMGAKGGKDAEADEDMSEEAGREESAGNAREQGKSQAENYGKNGGKKIFELDRTGNLGLNPDRTPVTDGKVAKVFAGSLIFILGVASYLLRIRDKKDKKNYF